MGYIHNYQFDYGERPTVSRELFLSIHVQYEGGGGCMLQLVCKQVSLPSLCMGVDLGTRLTHSMLTMQWHWLSTECIYVNSSSNLYYI